MSTIKNVCEKLLLVQNEEGIGLAYEDILQKVKLMIPGAQTTGKCLAWYSSKMKKAGVKLPARARAQKPGREVRGITQEQLLTMTPEQLLEKVLAMQAQAKGEEGGEAGE